MPKTFLTDNSNLNKTHYTYIQTYKQTARAAATTKQTKSSSNDKQTPTLPRREKTH